MCSLIKICIVLTLVIFSSALKLKTTLPEPQRIGSDPRSRPPKPELKIGVLPPRRLGGDPSSLPPKLEEKKDDLATHTANENTHNISTVAGKSVNAKVNGPITISGNITTGYTWALKDFKEGHLKSLNGEKGTYEPKKVSKGIVGAGGTHVFRFSGLKKGSQQLSFQQIAWGKPSDNIQTVTVVVA